MNLREGSRRLALLLGVVGLLAGCFFGYMFIAEDAPAWWNSHNFYALTNLPDVERAQESFLRGQHIAVSDPDTAVITLNGPKVASFTVQVSGGDIANVKRTDGKEFYAPFRTVTLWDVIYPMSFPLLGFLAGWLPIKLLAWVIMGFTKQV